MNMPRALPLALLACSAALSGCSSFSLPKMPEPWVKPYERERLADPIMKGSADPLSGRHREHVLVVREAEANFPRIVDFTHQVSLCRAANGRIAGHMRHGVHRQRADADADAQPGRRKRSLTTGVTGANNHDVELPVGLHLPMQKRLNT